jgi:hypothetical protein
MLVCRLIPLFAAVGITAAQQPSAPSGISPEWDIKAHMSSFVEDVKRLEPLLEQVNVKQWVEGGAPEAYIRQLQSSKASVQNLIAGTDALAQNPDRLTVALEAYFRMETMETLLGSLKEGVRRYQDPAIANQFTTLLAANSLHRDRLRRHITELAAAREQELKVVDQEAQRCRGDLSRQSPAGTRQGNRKQESR